MAIHQHQRLDSGGRSVLFIAFILTMVMMIIELAAGMMSRSLSLTADAGHMLTDASALALSLFAAWMARKPATPAKSYGYYRTEILAALANGVALWIMIIWVSISALQRLQRPHQVLTGPMIVIALVGLIVNLFIAALLARDSRTNLNVRSAWYNVLADALGSLGVIIAGVLIRWYGWTAADPVASLIIALLIAWNSWSLIAQSVNVLLEGTPSHIRMEDVVEAMRGVVGVHEVHDVHLWTITTGLEAMSGHVTVADVSRSPQVLADLNDVLKQRFGLTHTTIQLEPRSAP